MTTWLAKKEASDLVGNLEITKLSHEQKMELAIKILKKGAEVRTPREIEFLKLSTENIQFFKETVSKLGFNTHDLLCQRMYHVFVAADHNLFEAGSLGTTFYIILKGRVGVIINLPKPGKNELEPTEVAELAVGASFGELSLMETVMKPRAATILCKEDSHFAVLDKKPYQEILGLAEKKKLDLKIDFLHGLDVFRNVGWTRHALKSIIMLFKHQQFPKAHVVYNEGEQSDLIMAIKSGEVKFTKKIAINPRAAEAIIVNEKSEVVSQENLPMHKIVELSTMGPNQLFGDDEAFLEIPRQSTATVVTAEAEIWTINKREFIKKLYTFDTSYRIFVQQAKSKKQWREERINDICQIAENKINTDILIGTANKLRSTVHTDLQTKLNLKYYERKQAQESIAHQADRAERLLQQSLIILHNKSTSQPPTSRGFGNSPSYAGHNINQSELADSLIFYHNEPNNGELKAFLDSKMKLKDIDEKSSRIVYNTSQQNHLISSYVVKNSIQSEKPEATTYQSFIGSYQQEHQKLNESADDVLGEKKNAENTSVWTRLATNININTNQANKNATIDSGNEPRRSFRGRISNNRQANEFNVTNKLIRQVEARQKLQEQQLQNESLFRSTLAEGVERPRGESARQNKTPEVNITFTRTLNKFYGVAKRGGQKEELSLTRKKISSRADDRSHEVSKWKNMMSFLPQRVKKNAKLLDSKTIETTPRQLRITPQKELNKTIDLARGSNDNNKLDSIINLSSAPESTKGDRNQTVASRALNLSAVIGTDNVRQGEDSSPDATRTQKGHTTRISQQMLPDESPIGAFQRTRLFEQTLLQRFKRTGRVRDITSSPEEERQRLLAAYENYKSFRIKLRATNK